jgi:hypothetical protein
MLCYERRGASTIDHGGDEHTAREQSDRAADVRRLDTYAQYLSTPPNYRRMLGDVDPIVASGDGKTAAPRNPMQKALPGAAAKARAHCRWRRRTTDRQRTAAGRPGHPDRSGRSGRSICRQVRRTARVRAKASNFFSHSSVLTVFCEIDVDPSKRRATGGLAGWEP